MENWPRAFAYTAGSLTIGGAIYIFTHGFFRFVEHGLLVSFITLLCFAIIFGNMAYVIARRFDRKVLHGVTYPFVLGITLVLPSIIFIIMNPKNGVAGMQPVLFAVLIGSTLVGSYFGIRSGLRKRNELLSTLQDGDRVPDSLKHPGKSISSN